MLRRLKGTEERTPHSYGEESWIFSKLRRKTKVGIKRWLSFQRGRRDGRKDDTGLPWGDVCILAESRSE